MDKMVVAVELGREYLGRCRKLMLICGKIKQTMQGAGRVTIQNHHGATSGSSVQRQFIA